MPERWATFDCYGTLIDWNAGVRDVLASVFGGENADRLLARYHELEPEVQREDPSRSYRVVLAEVLRRLATEERVELSDTDALGRSLPGWRPFSETRAALDELRARGWRLAILSNTDPDFLAASMEQIGVEIDLCVIASEIGSYKPAPGHWERFFADSDARPDRHVHVAASHFHDIVPASELRLRSVWINRLGEGETEPRPTRELRDLTQLPEVLDELVPR
ncbi:MAG: HAD-IA family hydrolase [Actinomycetota bacterium]|nr:HAD-IA family hydrolase [Actinomycetota bacterium]